MRAVSSFVGLALLASCAPSAREARSPRTALAPASPTPATPCEPHRIGRIHFTGATPDTTAALAPLAVLDGTLDNPLRAERVAALATEALRGVGYPRAKIVLERGPGCGVELHARIALGPKFRIGKIQFVANDAFPAKRRVALIEDALGTVNTVGGVYVADRLDQALQELQRRYRDAGWARARIETFVADYDEARGLVSLTIPIEAGPRFRFGVIRAIGARGASGDLFDALGVSEGEPYDKASLTAGLARARARLERRIKLRAVISDERGTIDIEAIVGRRAR